MNGHYPQFQKKSIYTKGVSTPFVILQILIYTTIVSWFWFYIEGKHFLQFKKKNWFIVKASTIPQNLIYTKCISSKDTFYIN